MEWFSEPKDTIKEAEDLFTPGLFRVAAVFLTQDSKFVMAELRSDRDWPPHRTAKEIKRLTGNTMIAVCDPLLGVWMPYKAA